MHELAEILKKLEENAFFYYSEHKVSNGNCSTVEVRSLLLIVFQNLSCLILGKFIFILFRYSPLMWQRCCFSAYQKSEADEIWASSGDSTDSTGQQDARGCRYLLLWLFKLGAKILVWNAVENQWNEKGKRYLLKKWSEALLQTPKWKYFSASSGDICLMNLKNMIFWVL